MPDESPIGETFMEAALESINAHFSELEDPRVNVHNQRHSLEDILILTILAVM